MDAAENRLVGLHRTDTAMREIRIKKLLPLLG